MQIDQVPFTTLPAPPARNTALDFVRIFGVFTVIGVHFFLNTPFYQTQITGFPMLLAVTGRCFFIICIPIFLILSGYLLSTREMSKKYYKRIIHILITYVFAFMTTLSAYIAFRHYHFTVGECIRTFLAFTLPGPAWYIRMYIGLFLLIPILNAAYNYLDSKRKKQILVGTYVFISIIPSVVSVYDFSSLSWWKKPSTSFNYFNILPTWWQSDQICYTSYYFIGCYMKDFPLPLKAPYALLLAFIFTILSGLYNFWRSYDTTFVGGQWAQYSSPFTMSIVVCMVHFFVSINFNGLPKVIKRIAQELSGYCEGAFMVSAIFDTFMYSWVFGSSYKFIDVYPYLPLVVTGILICSLALGAVLYYIQKLCTYMGKIVGSIVAVVIFGLMLTIAILVQ